MAPERSSRRRGHILLMLLHYLSNPWVVDAWLPLPLAPQRRVVVASATTADQVHGVAATEVLRWLANDWSRNGLQRESSRSSSWGETSALRNMPVEPQPHERGLRLCYVACPSDSIEVLVDALPQDDNSEVGCLVTVRRGEGGKGALGVLGPQVAALVRAAEAEVAARLSHDLRVVFPTTESVEVVFEDSGGDDEGRVEDEAKNGVDTLQQNRIDLQQHEELSSLKVAELRAELKRRSISRGTSTMRKADLVALLAEAIATQDDAEDSLMQESYSATRVRTRLQEEKFKSATDEEDDADDIVHPLMEETSVSPENLQLPEGAAREIVEALSTRVTGSAFDEARGSGGAGAVEDALLASLTGVSSSREEGNTTKVAETFGTFEMAVDEMAREANMSTMDLALLFRKGADHIASTSVASLKEGHAAEESISTPSSRTVTALAAQRDEFALRASTAVGDFSAVGPETVQMSLQPGQGMDGYGTDIFSGPPVSLTSSVYSTARGPSAEGAHDFPSRRPLETLTSYERQSVSALKGRLSRIVRELGTTSDDLFYQIMEAYRDVVLDDWYPVAARQLLSELDSQITLDRLRLNQEAPTRSTKELRGAFASKDDNTERGAAAHKRSSSTSGQPDAARLRRALGRVNDFALACAEELAAMVQAAEEQQLEKIRRICEAAMKDMNELPGVVAGMKPLLDRDFIGYLTYAIGIERDRIRYGSSSATRNDGGGTGIPVLDPDREPTPWLQVLSLIRKGTYAELAKDLRADIQAVTYILRMPDPETQRALLSKTIDTLPSWDVRQFHRVVANIVSNFERQQQQFAFDRSDKHEIGSTPADCNTDALMFAKDEVSNEGNKPPQKEVENGLYKKITQLGLDLKELLPPERLATLAAPADAAKGLLGANSKASITPYSSMPSFSESDFEAIAAIDEELHRAEKPEEMAVLERNDLIGPIGPDL